VLRRLAGARKARYLSWLVAASALVIAFAGDATLTPFGPPLTPHRVVIVTSTACKFGEPSAFVVCRNVPRATGAPDALATERTRP